MRKSRKQLAMEERHKSQSGFKPKMSKQQTESLRECTLEDVLASFEIAYKYGLWVMTMFSDNESWRNEAWDIIETAKETTKGTSIHHWRDQCIAEFNKRNSPLYKAMK